MQTKSVIPILLLSTQILSACSGITQEDYNKAQSEAESRYNVLQSQYDALKITNESINAEKESLSIEKASVNAEYRAYQKLMEPYESEAESIAAESSQALAESIAVEESIKAKESEAAAAAISASLDARREQDLLKRNAPDELELMTYAQTVLDKNLDKPQYSRDKSKYTFITNDYLRYKIEGVVNEQNFYMVIEFTDQSYDEFDLISLQVGKTDIVP